METKLTELEKLRIKYEMLEIENKMLKDDIHYLKLDKEFYKKWGQENLEARISLLRKLIEQQRFVRMVITVNAGLWGLYDLAANFYHQLPRN